MRGCSHLCSALFSPSSYFKSSLPAPLLSRGLVGFVSRHLLKDNAQMGALVGGLGWAARRLIQAWSPCAAAGSLETSCFGF